MTNTNMRLSHAVLKGEVPVVRPPPTRAPRLPPNAHTGPSRQIADPPQCLHEPQGSWPMPSLAHLGACGGISRAIRRRAHRPSANALMSPVLGPTLTRNEHLRSSEQWGRCHEQLAPCSDEGNWGADCLHESIDEDPRAPASISEDRKRAPRRFACSPAAPLIIVEAETASLLSNYGLSLQNTSLEPESNVFCFG